MNLQYHMWLKTHATIYCYNGLREAVTAVRFSHKLFSVIL